MTELQEFIKKCKEKDLDDVDGIIRRALAEEHRNTRYAATGVVREYFTEPYDDNTSVIHEGFQMDTIIRDIQNLRFKNENVQ